MTTDREGRFNELLELAAFIAHAPMASLAIVEAETVWFKATLGFEVDTLDRHDTICGATVDEQAPLIISDTTQDPRFVDNPMVVDDPGVRFYAGFPLFLDDDLAVGTLCVFDRRPRTLLSDERYALRIVADQMAGQLQLDRLEELLRDRG